MEMNISYHHTKYVYIAALHAQSAEEVSQVLEECCFTNGFPRKISDNSKEFKNCKMKEFYKQNKIEQVRGSPRTRRRQGVVERSNRS